MPKKIIIRLTWAATALILPLYAWKVYLKNDYTDFGVYYTASLQAQESHWDKVYDLNGGASPFRYAPPLLLLFKFFAFSSPVVARLSWYFFQFFCYVAGFILLERTFSQLKEGRKNQALFLTCLGSLFVLRFCLDCFTIGQISGLLFLGFCMALRGYVLKRPSIHAIGAFLPALTKLGPMVSLIPALFEKRRSFLKFFLYTLFALAACTFLSSLLFTRDFSVSLFLWKQWIRVVSLDSQYFDSSHAGSQCLNSFLLRHVNAGWLSLGQAQWLRMAISIGTSAILILFWLFRRPRRLMGRWLFFTLSIYPYLLLMPQTFKYSLSALALPVIGLMGLQKKSICTWVALIAGVAFLSIPGKDVVGDFLFFSIQKKSFPFMSISLLMIAHFIESYRRSFPSRFFRSLIFFPPLLPGHFTHSKSSSSGTSLLIPLPLNRGVPFDLKMQEVWMRAWHALQESKDCEILVIPYGNFQSLEHPFYKHWIDLSKVFPQLNILPPDAKRSEKSQSLQEGVRLSRGNLLLILNLEQMVDTEFFIQAIHLMKQDTKLIRANRRLHNTRFRVPTRLLAVTRRHFEIGRAFNRMIRFFLPLQTTDTQSGTYAMRRDFAILAFSGLRIRNFLFELEIALLASLGRHQTVDLPATFSIPFEKLPARIFVETLQTLLWVPALIRRIQVGCYDALPQSSSCQITADDWGMSPGINEGILELAQAGLIRRVSILATGPFVEKGLKELMAIPGIELGLHLNLTFPPFSDRRLHSSSNRAIHSPASFLVQWLNPLNRSKLEEFALDEAKKQLQTLNDLGVRTRYLDGHHHIHLVPGLMDCLMPLIQAHGIHCIRLPLSWGLLMSRKFPLILLSLAARRKFKKLGFHFLPCFYPKLRLFTDPKLLRALLNRKPGSEVIVHPAKKDDLALENISDPYRAQRVVEFQGLRVLKHISYG